MRSDGSWSFVQSKVVISLAENERSREAFVKSMTSLQIQNIKLHIVDRHPKGGNYGCCNSHLEVIRHAYFSGQANIMVFEDDARAFGYATSEMCMRVLGEIQRIDWDVPGQGRRRSQNIFWSEV